MKEEMFDKYTFVVIVQLEHLKKKKNIFKNTLEKAKTQIYIKEIL